MTVWINLKTFQDFYGQNYAYSTVLKDADFTQLTYRSRAGRGRNDSSVGC